MNLKAELLAELQQKIDNDIKPAAAMKFSIAGYDGERFALGAPKQFNTNHHGTVFGGSLYAIAAVAGWGVLRCKLDDYQLEGTIVVKEAGMRYLRPVTEDFVIHTQIHPEDDLAQVMQTYRDTGSCNLRIHGEIQNKGKDAAIYDGVYSVKDLSRLGKR
ncbi:YiiD C-terminal domain-containing protein [Granulosicoccaceae sp. 1_MG-2023]|nr:YiiD C-terminal domain-containing protein [Granulosicoccaceae sp. 1_MG-2023]